MTFGTTIKLELKRLQLQHLIATAILLPQFYLKHITAYLQADKLTKDWKSNCYLSQTNPFIITCYCAFGSKMYIMFLVIIKSSTIARFFISSFLYFYSYNSYNFLIVVVKKCRYIYKYSE